jgi:hypothetical protein
VTESPPGEKQRPRVGTEGAADNITKAPLVPASRPWKDVATERRFQVDRVQWRRRILCSRRTSHDGQDPVAPRGRWSR